MKFSLANKPILIVEDYPGMRKAMRDMLGTLNANFIVEAENGAEALNAMTKQKFDVVLCDYNLGNGKNAQQVLEEARYRKLLPYHCVFIIATAEQTSTMVLGAMENKPDEYLTKPFNAQQLATRLQKHFARKRYLANIEREIDRGNPAQAIQHCDRLLAQAEPAMQTPLQKIRAELAIGVGDFDKARAIYAEVLQRRALPWATLGLGIVDLRQNRVERAIETFEKLVAEHPLFLEGYDWLAKAYETARQMQAAENVLNQAADLSPQSILRQQKLAETADKNGNLQVAEKAYKAAVKLGKHSVHKSPSDFSGLAKVYSKSQATDEALQTLEEMRREYVNHPEAELRAAALEVEVYRAKGQDEPVKLALEKMLALQAEIGSDVPKGLQLDIVKTCFLNDAHDVAERILDTLIKTHIEDDGFIDEIRTMQTSIGMENHSEVLIQKTKKDLIDINNRGVALYRQGRLHDALVLFEQAIATLPDNKTIVLNMAKIVLHDLKQSGITEEKLLRVQAVLKKAKLIGVPAEKLGVIQMEFAKLVTPAAKP